MNYLNVTYEQLLQDFRARLNSDPHFKNIGSATIYGMFQEMLCACMDMTNFYMQRTAEEAFISTARLDSSVIKHGKGLGYNPRRAVPARCELVIRLKGPLPSSIIAGTEVFFNQETTDLNFNGNKYILDSSYSYVFTQDDVNRGQSSDWFKELRFSVPQEKATYLPLVGINYYDTTHTVPIKCFQGERKTVEILGTANMDKIGEPNQFYDINDLDFSDWYGRRDPYGFRNNVFYPELSWCQVGIGADEVDAFNKKNIYDIETQAIHLNENVVKIKGNEPPETPLKVCLIDTNSDKTVRVSFSTEPNICDIGLKTYKDNLYVKYIATKGKECNTTGVKGSVMSHNNQVNVSVNGNIIDITNNVQFIINSDIYGGEYFENQNSIRINAPAYFSSCGKLVTKEDYTSYFRGLTSPITVQNALVYGQMELEDNLDQVIHKLVQNNIFYTLMGHLYVKNSGNWEPRNLLTDHDNNNDAFTIYGDKYLDHLCDLIKMLYSYEGYFNKIYKLDSDEQWIKNTRLVYENCKHKMEVNSVLMPMVPFLQYFDIVGTVYVDPLTDIADYTKEMQNKVYEYLDQKLATDRKIYKSEIIDLYNKNDRTKSVNIDIKISDVIKSTEMTYAWSGQYNSDFRVRQNKQLDSYINEAKTYDQINSEYGKGWWNEIVISKLDQNGNTLNAGMFKERKAVYEITFADYNGSSYSKNVKTYSLKCDVTEDDDYVYLYPSYIQPEGSSSKYRDFDGRGNKATSSAEIASATDDGVIVMNIKLPNYSDFYSTSNLLDTNVDEYRLSKPYITEVINDLNSWLYGLQKVEQANRPIPLKYEVYSNNELTRVESIMRKGNLITTKAKTLSEQSFWNYFVPLYIIDKQYAGKYDNAHKAIGLRKINETTEYDSDEWKAATNLIMDIYPLVKPGICDSILDDNNNIVNFSTDLELPVVYNKINVKYKAN